MSPCSLALVDPVTPLTGLNFSYHVKPTNGNTCMCIPAAESGHKVFSLCMYTLDLDGCHEEDLKREVFFHIFPLCSCLNL